jgi:hypothetical protein
MLIVVTAAVDDGYSVPCPLVSIADLIDPEASTGVEKWFQETSDT